MDGNDASVSRAHVIGGISGAVTVCDARSAADPDGGPPHGDVKQAQSSVGWLEPESVGRRSEIALIPLLRDCAAGCSEEMLSTVHLEGDWAELERELAQLRP
jgi:hypothetical protein